MPSHEIMREGRMSGDGRLLMPSSVTWYDEPIPVCAPVEDEPYSTRVIGFAYNVRREGDVIYVDFDGELGDDVFLSASVDSADLREEDEMLIFDTCRLIGLVIQPIDNYPWKV